MLRATDAQLAPLSLSTNIDRLVPVVAVGYPPFTLATGEEFGKMMQGGAAIPAPVFTPGEVSTLQDVRGQRLVVHTASINSGNSGGPLADRCGRVVGINTFIRVDRETGYRVDYALAAADLKAFLASSNITPVSDDTPCQPLAAPTPVAQAAPPVAPIPGPVPGPATTPTPATPAGQLAR